MKIIDGIAYENTQTVELEVTKIKVIDNMKIAITFNNNDKKIFDATTILNIPVFEILKDEEIFKSYKIVNGILTWCNGDVDIATETLYKLCN